MAHPEGVYEQIIEVNNTNQGTEFLSHQLVQEIVIQNDSDQGVMSGIEIMLPNDCVQDPCDSNIMVPCNTDGVSNEKQGENVILNQEANKNENASPKNFEDSTTSYSECSKEEKGEDHVLQNKESHHQENFEENNSLVETNSDIDSKIAISETIVETNGSVPLVNDGESVPDFSHGESTDNHNDIINIKTTSENKSDSEHKNLESIEREEVSACKKELDSLPLEKEKFESLNLETMPENDVFNEKLVTIESHLENHSSEPPITEADILGLDKSDESIKEDKNSIGEEFSERDEYSVLVSEAVSDTKIDTNSDDVAVLTEFSSMEYNMQEEISEEHIEENHQEQHVEENHNETTATESMQEDAKSEKETVEGNKLNDSEAVVAEANSEKSKEEPKSIDASCELVDTEVDEDGDLELHLSTQSTESHRKVIQDIFDDWQDENGDEENNQLSANFKDQQDSVEMELESLLSDGAQQEQTVSSTNSTEHPLTCSDSSESTEKNDRNSPGKTLLKSEKSSSIKNVHESPKTANKSPKQPANASTKDHLIGRSPKNALQDSSDSKAKLQSPRPGVKVPGLHLTSQIATTAEVNEVLKERLREKQKDLVNPKTADIVFVKKITQRLSSQLLSAASTNVPPLIPLQTSTTGDSDNDKAKTVEPTTSESNKSTTSTDNKELLAILEGDVDPDWSNLKSQSIADESNKEVHSGTKLDPVTERELALKQLLELPNISTKKNNSGIQKKNKKNLKQLTNKATGTDVQMESKATGGDVINLDSTDEDSPKKKKALKENNSLNTRSNSTPTVAELNVEESRSGRKRKLTEKAREHELTVKRQKVNKGKPVESKKPSQEPEEPSKQKSQTPVKSEPADSTSSSTPKSSQSKLETKSGKIDGKLIKTESKTESIKTDTVSTGVRGKLPLKRSKLGVLKKDAPIVKRKGMVKNLMRQKMTSRKMANLAKEKLQTPTRTVSPTKGVPEKPTSTTPGTKTKKVTEIDRLLQDEGVVNLLYDVEQPDLRKRLVPITKSQKKVMDMEKAERELKLRTKLVRNAVLRLRNSSAQSLKISPRSRRNPAASPSEPSIPQSDKKVNETIKALKVPPSASVPSDFIIPAKIRNAADASRIIRRHSSSSFSSASASPRVSVDQPPEQMKIEESEIQTKTKRKLSQDSTEKVDMKKNKKKVTEEKEVSEKSPEKELVKKMTRSNVALAGVATAMVKAKNKKVLKSKTSSESSSGTAKSPVKNQEELSACLAEAASVLSNISGTSRGTNSSTNRKKGSTNISKSQADDEKVDGKKLFSNKEINVRQHGHLVQLILTPSTPISGIRNAITIQVMNELREALSILKNDEDCRVVLFTSTGTSFCEGLELSSLLNSNKEERKSRAEEMANAVKEFIRTLASFNKPIVAGVQGAAIGLGVTMLPLFDLVIASDKATFSTPYGKLGQIAEGAAVLTLSHSLGTAVTNELLLGGRVLTASEALRAGLVTRVLWPDRFQGELLPSLKSMSEQSSQSMKATKSLLRQSLRDKLDVSLDSESLLLVQHWCTSECQEAIKAFIEEKGQ